VETLLNSRDKGARRGRRNGAFRKRDRAGGKLKEKGPDESPRGTPRVLLYLKVEQGRGLLGGTMRVQWWPLPKWSGNEKKDKGVGETS